MEMRFGNTAKESGMLTQGAAGALTISVASPADASLLAGLIRVSFQPVAQLFGLTAENCPRHPSNCQPDWIEKDRARGVVYFLLKAVGEPCGCAAFEKADADGCYLERLAVLPAHQRKGYGRMLVAHVVDFARQAGSHHVRIAIIAKHQSLRTWYERLGFVAQETKAFPQLPFEIL